MRKRKDGYHDLETIFYSLPVTDVLEIVSLDERDHSGSIPISFSGLHIELDIGNNLVSKAYKLLKKDFPALPHVKMHLHKTIPSGAGLGGGSADASFALRLLNDKFGLHLSNKQLINYAFQLGSDCPFFILNKPCYATGTGEILEPIQINLKGFKIILIFPGISINTGQAFRNISSGSSSESLKEIISQPPETWKGKLINDFEKPVFKQFPAIAEVKEKLYAEGAIYASMSGSGSSVFGIFSIEKPTNLDVPKEYWIRELIC